MFKGEVAVLQYGDWVHIREESHHPFSGYDGEVVAIRDNSVLVEIHDVMRNRDGNTLRLESHLYLFHRDEVKPVPAQQQTTFDVLQSAVHKWNTRH